MTLKYGPKKSDLVPEKTHQETKILKNSGNIGEQ